MTLHGDPTLNPNPYAPEPQPQTLKTPPSMMCYNKKQVAVWYSTARTCLHCGVTIICVSDLQEGSAERMVF